MTGDQLAAVAAMGAFHGLNPGMGWLFAVALGLQERSRRALFRALPPIALGHALSIGAVAVVVAVSGSILASRLVTVVGGALLVGFGLWRLLSRRHFRWAGMRVSGRQLAYWSFLMSSVDGAGLMLLPVLIPHQGSMSMPGMPMPGAAPPLGAALTHAVVVTLVHALAMVTVAGVMAVVVYEVLGLRILRTAWINLDKVWAVALIGAGIAVMVV